jgi:2-methylisocitrate lyase-like PEP mutase family enzyme
MSAPGHFDGLAERAGRLRALHVPGRPLVLPNAWDAASARIVEAAGFPAVATASSAISESLGYEDEEGTPPGEMFASIQRIARAVAVPVTADVEGGYGLPSVELAERLLDTGAVGCNLEDTAHGQGGLIDADVQCQRIAALREAASHAGVPIVINARVDVYLLQSGDPEGRTEEALRRGRLYLEAGADCIYPIMVTDEATIATFVEAFGGMVNVYARPQAPLLPRLAALGVARVSFGPWVHRLAMRDVEAMLRDIAASLDPYATRVPESRSAQ